MQERGKGPSTDFCLTTGWIPTLAKLARLTRSVTSEELLSLTSPATVVLNHLFAAVIKSVCPVYIGWLEERSDELTVSG